MRKKNITITHIKRWLNLLIGNSYYHQPQNIGKLYNAHEIKGYFNDLTQKAIWYGEIDNIGIPINILIDGRKKVYFATTIVQKALGHYDNWLLSKKTKHFDQFITLCDWLVDNQDDRGGWREQVQHGQTGFLCKNDREFVYYSTRAAFEEKERKIMIQNARDWLDTNWGVEKAKEEWSNFLAKVEKG